jgi:hypothetical protein
MDGAGCFPKCRQTVFQGGQQENVFTNIFSLRLFLLFRIEE